MKKLFFAELLAGLLIVLVGAGTAAIIAPTIVLQKTLTVGLGFFLAVILVSQTVGHISGGHGNPSITIGHLVAGKLDVKTSVIYIVAQFIGAIFGGLIIYLAMHAAGSLEGAEAGVMATNIIPDGMIAFAALFEAFITFIFVTIILFITNENNPNNGRAPIVIAISLAVLVMLASPITGGSLNAARSFGVALFEGGTALSQYFVFLIFPAIGAAIAGAVYSIVIEDKK